MGSQSHEQDRNGYGTAQVLASAPILTIPGHEQAVVESVDALPTLTWLWAHALRAVAAGATQQAAQEDVTARVERLRGRSAP